MNYRASQTTTVNLLTDRTILSGQTITIFGFIIANSTNNPAEILIADGDGNNLIIITVPPKNSKSNNTQWIADNGVQVSGIGSADVFFTVFHSAGGS